jgi:hypothetical protein
MSQSYGHFASFAAFGAARGLGLSARQVPLRRHFRQNARLPGFPNRHWKFSMKKMITAAMALVLAACSSGSGAPARDLAVVNGDFKQTAADGSIPGWKFVQHAGPRSYDTLIDKQGAYKDSGSFRMTRIRDQFYGTLAQDVAVGSAAGQTVELSAMMKTADVGPKGWELMIAGAGVREFSPPLSGTGDWQRITLRAQVPKTTTTISVGATLLDGGTGWLDDVQLRVVGR